MNLDILESSETESDDDLNPPRRKVYRPRINFELNDFVARFRFTKVAMQRIVAVIGADLQHDSHKNFALSPTQQLLLGLRYLSGAGFMLAVGDSHGPSKATVCRAVKRVVIAINAHYFDQIIDFPADCDRTAAAFYQVGRMPCVVGAVDGTHFPIKAPTVDEPQFVNRHQAHSINAMMVSGPDYKFYYVNSRFPGSVNDARVLRQSALATRFNAGWRPIPNAVILGDSGYGLSEWLIPPISNENLHTVAEERFNRAHKKMRNKVECAFGVLKQRWSCLRFLRLDPNYSAEVIKACAVLHNLSIIEKPLTEEEIREVQIINNHHAQALLADNNIDEEDVEEDNLGMRRRLQLVNHFA